METQSLNNRGSKRWIQTDSAPEASDHALESAILRVNQPVFVLDLNDKTGVSQNGFILIGTNTYEEANSYKLKAYAPPLHPKDLGDSHFKKLHKIKYAYVAGAMANGIASVQMVQEAGRSGMLGFFGAGGLSIEQIESAIISLKQKMGDHSFGFNLIHSPNDPDLEIATVDLYLKHKVRLISAAAFMRLTLPLVYYRIKGIHKNADGKIICPNKVIAKVSRVEVARRFFSPPPEKMIRHLVEKNMITSEEASLASLIPVAEAMTAEADSGGHTDNRPALSLLPTMLSLRDEMAKQYNYQTSLSVGLGGGIATPESAAAAFAMGAAYILTGSVNQSCIEAGTSEEVRKMLAEAGQADVTMAPAADMFEMGVKVQVLKRGTMFSVRASKLYDLYSRYNRYEDIPEKERLTLENKFFRNSFEEEWLSTRTFFAERDPKQIIKAEENSKHKMALVFRSYLGRSSMWAVTGEASRKIDFQIWCGPAIGAFNEWVKGSFLEKPENRTVQTVAMNILLGASVATRANWLRNQGATLPEGAGRFSPMNFNDIGKLLEQHNG
jgi:trans-AT polyketide synthase, acyltransferase and oxidoreductase domains